MNPLQIAFEVEAIDAAIPLNHSLRSVLIDRFREGWREIHTATDQTVARLNQIIASLPSTGCSCNYAEALEAVPVREHDWFKWSVDLHNWVSRKLGKRTLSYEDALRVWFPQKAGKQPKTSSLIAVTSLAPHRLDRQSVCLDSWKQLGIDVVSVNSQAEIESMAADYPQVSKWIHAEYARTPRINSLLDVTVSEDLPSLLVNSDIEIYGDQARLIDLVEARKCAIGVRHNYALHPVEAKQEMWGLDAFLVYPEQVEQCHRTDFAIGVPMWDWWLPWELHRVGAECEWIEEPFFFHKNHPQAWSEATCVQQKAYFADLFGPVDFIKWRQARSFEGC